MKKILSIMLLLSAFLCLESCGEGGKYAEQIADEINNNREEIMSTGIFQDFHCDVKGKDIVMTMRVKDELAQYFALAGGVPVEELTNSMEKAFLDEVLYNGSLGNDDETREIIETLADEGYSIGMVMEIPGSDDLSFSVPFSRLKR